MNLEQLGIHDNLSFFGRGVLYRSEYQIKDKGGKESKGAHFTELVQCRGFFVFQAFMALDELSKCHKRPRRVTAGTRLVPGRGSWRRSATWRVGSRGALEAVEIGLCRIQIPKSGIDVGVVVERCRVRHGDDGGGCICHLNEGLYLSLGRWQTPRKVSREWHIMDAQ